MILAIDQGTTGTTCLVFDGDGRIRGRAYSEFGQHFPRPGWVEHDANEIWEVTRRVARHALADAKADPARSTRSGSPTSARPSSPGTRDTGEPVHNALVWQDRRTAARCDELREAGHEDLVRERTGLVLDPYFSGTKIEWLLRQRRGRARRRLRDDRLLARLQAHRAATRPTSPTPRGRCSSTSASCRWDPELCELLGVDPRAPARGAAVGGRRSGRRPSSAARSRSRGSPATSRRRSSARRARRRGWRRTPTAPAASSSSTPATSVPEPEDGLLTTIAWGIGDRVTYALEAAVFVTGAAVQWLRDGHRDRRRGGGDRGHGGVARVQRRRLLRARR